MLEQIISHKKFWILRFKDRVQDSYIYAMNVGGGGRAEWSWTTSAGVCAQFRTERHAARVLRSPKWASVGFTNKREFITEIVQIDERVTQSWTELQVITNESALIQLARLAKDMDEHNDDSND